MAPGESSRRSSSKSKKPSKHDSDDEEDRPSPRRKSSSHSSSSSKNVEKAPKTSILKSMFTRDHSEAKSILASEMFKDDSRKSSSRSKSSKPKTEKARPEKLVEKEETYTDEPDFSKFVSAYSEPVKEKKVEKKPPKKQMEEKKKDEKNKETPKKEIRKPKSPVIESGRYVSRPIPSAFASKTAFKSTYDISMAGRQTKIAELKGEELVEQEKWAQDKLKAHAGTCPMGYNWSRFKQNALPGQVEMEGYRCLGGNHFVTHELLSQGKGDIYITTDLYSKHVGQILEREIPVYTPFIGGQRWRGPVSLSDVQNKNDKPPITIEEYALQLIPTTFGFNIHPAMIPQLQMQLVEQLKQEEKEDREEFEEFLRRPGSKGGPWWEDCN
ncbi:hypothetical protein BKA64DRAFT_724174 [Cadophora sp. MPI-SDFR-AT-0126]|nr:hypothetical protein BKA64DRAFT_724174 [Leotiomycetes sp. MPI-SDFR-AT-0126]